MDDGFKQFSFQRLAGRVLYIGPVTMVSSQVYTLESSTRSYSYYNTKSSYKEIKKVKGENC